MSVALTKEGIRALLEEPTPRGARAVERALIVLKARQTADEVSSEKTKHDNNRGFMPADARVMTSMAKQVERSYRPKGEKLSLRQLAWLRYKNPKGVARIGKYHRQLIEEATEKA